MKTRKEVIQFIAQRYGLGYSEVINSNIYLTSAYLPNSQKIYDAKMPKVPGAYLLDHDPFINFVYKEQLGVAGIYSSSVQGTYLRISSPEKKLSQAEIDKIIIQLDEKFSQTEIKPSEEKQNSHIFDNYQIGIKNPITTNKVLWGLGIGRQKAFGDTHYSIIFTFSKSDNLYLFLDSIPKASKTSAPAETYVTYQCSYGCGCYQILVPYGNEYKALSLLLGKNLYISELPVTQFILSCLQPKSFLSSCFSYSLSDMEYSAALNIIQKSIIKKENLSFSDFDETTIKIIQSNNGLKKSLSSTINFFKKNHEFGKLLETFFPTVLTDIIMGYNGCHSKRR